MSLTSQSCLFSNLYLVIFSRTPKPFHRCCYCCYLTYSDEMEKIKIPKDMEDAKALGTVLSKYKDTYYTQVLMAYFTTYILYPLKKCMQNHFWFWVNSNQLIGIVIYICLVLLAIRFGLCCRKRYAIFPHTDLLAIVRQDMCGNQCIGNQCIGNQCIGNRCVVIVVAITTTLPWHINSPTFSDWVAVYIHKDVVICRCFIWRCLPTYWVLMLLLKHFIEFECWTLTLTHTSQPSDFCHPRINLSQYPVRVSLPVSSGTFPGLLGE